jgi:uncharacterized damage-inducible protein DinB
MVDLKELFLKQKQTLRSRTRQVLDLLKPEDMSWRPIAGALSVGEMLRHLHTSEQGVRRVALDSDFAYYEARIPGGLPAVVGTPGTLKDELSAIDRVHEDTLALVAQFPLEWFDQERVHSGLGFRRKVYVVLMGINEHEVHHRAQLMTYLRMLGRPVPEPFQR